MRLWSLTGDEPSLTIPLYHSVLTCLALADSSLVVGLESGILSLEFPA